MPDLFSLQQDPSLFFAFFQVITSRILSSFTLFNVITTYQPSASINFQITNAAVDILKGILFTPTSSAIISNIQFGKELSLSMSI